MRASVIFGFLALATMAGCTSSPTDSYVDDYQRAQEQFPGSSESVELEAFFNLYSKLAGDDVAERVQRAYADEMFFNDTLHTSHSAADLADYMQETSERVDKVDVTILDHWQRGADVYVRWHMDTTFTVTGKQRHAQSVGITHLRFNEQGKIVLHQDFWDSTEGFYRHIPVSGHAINWIRSKL